MRWFDRLSPSLILLIIISLYLLIGVLYAVFTPAWQAPDEPAHYNYVRYLAEKGRFPVLHFGDYPHVYLEQIKAARFPPEMSIDPIRYEFWQPPMYYVLATPIYRLFQGALVSLRLLSVLLGAGVVMMAYAIALAIRPGDTTLALGAAAFVAFVPMHLTMMASVNNDALAELILAIVVLLLILLTRRPTGQKQTSPRTSFLVLIGILLGLGLVTKATVYVAIPLALIALLLSERRPVPLVQHALALFVPALLIAIPWYVRNVAVYGWPDLLGTINHAAVVVGQLRTADYLSTVGWATYLRDFLTITFHSFWGQFGWMAVPMDRRVYLALALFSALVIVGFVLFVWRGKEGKTGRLEDRKVGNQKHARQSTNSPDLPETQPSGHPAIQSSSLPVFQPSSPPVVLIALWLVLTSLVYLYYNIWLVQFQGRYLFPMLIPIGLLTILGLREILSRRWVWIAAGICGLAAILIIIRGAFGNYLDKWGLLIAGGAALVLVVRRWLPSNLDGWILALPLAGLAGLSIYSLFTFIVPYLSP
jgi:4-amino-4-deoxy-L-arabinose transferase-like glycosyltransferase